MGGNEGFSPCVQSILQMEPKLRELRSQSLMSSLIYFDKTYLSLGGVGKFEFGHLCFNQQC